MTCISEITTISVIVDLILDLNNISSLSLVTHDIMSIYVSCLFAVLRPQSGTTGNLMCKTQSAAILPIKFEFYGPDDLTAVSEVIMYFVQV